MREYFSKRYAQIISITGNLALPYHIHFELFEPFQLESYF